MKEKRKSKEDSVIPFRILYHEKGYMRLEVPSLKRLPWMFHFMCLKKSPPFPVPAGIKDFQINPGEGNIIITYESDRIDILQYIKKMASDPAIVKIMKV